MSLDQVLALVAQLQDAVNQLKDSQAQFSQSDVDAAVAAAVQPLNDQVLALQAQAAQVPDQIHAAVLAEDAVVAQKIKPLIDQINAVFSPQN